MTSSDRGADPLAGGREAAPERDYDGDVAGQLEAEQQAHSRIGDFLLPLVGTPDGTSVGAARAAADEIRALRSRVAALEEELAGSDARERRLVRHRIACMRAQRQAIRTRLVARLGPGHEADILAVLAEFEAEMDEPRQQAALAAAEASGPPEAGTPAEGGTTT